MYVNNSIMIMSQLKTQASLENLK